MFKYHHLALARIWRENARSALQGIKGIPSSGIWAKITWYQSLVVCGQESERVKMAANKEQSASATNAPAYEVPSW